MTLHSSISGLRFYHFFYFNNLGVRSGELFINQQVPAETSVSIRTNWQAPHMIETSHLHFRRLGTPRFDTPQSRKMLRDKESQVDVRFTVIYITEGKDVDLGGEEGIGR